jgi:hypothetical protein
MSRDGLARTIYNVGVRWGLALVFLAACGRLGFDAGSGDGGGVAPDSPPPAPRLDLLAGRHDPAGYADGTGTAARLSHPYATVAVGTKLYIADSGNGTIRCLDTTTGSLSTIAGTAWSFGSVDGTGAAARFEWVTGITYVGGLLYVADRSAHVIRSVDPATGKVQLVAGMFDVSGEVEGAAIGQATYSDPTSITTDGTDLFVLEFYGERVRRITLATGQTAFVAGGTDGNLDGIGAAAQFHYPTSIEYSAGVLYVGDLDNRAIRAVDPTTAAVTTTYVAVDGGLQVAETSGSDIYFGNVYGVYDYNMPAATTNRIGGSIWSPGAMDGDATTSLFLYPSGFTVIGNTLYIADEANSSIRTIDLASQVTTTLAGNFEPTAGPIDGVGAAARFDQLNGITTDGTHIWVTDENAYAISEVDPVSGAATLVAGTRYSWGTTDGVGSGALFHRPSGIAYSPLDGMLYDTDRDSHRVRRIDPTTYAVVTLTNPADLVGPGDIIVDNGVLYVADEYGQRIVSVDRTTGVVTPIAGSTTGVAGLQDGVGAGALFYYPRGLSMCGGQLYVAEKGNGTIRRVDPATGTVTTLVGGGDPVDGPIATARMSQPLGTVCDGNGIDVADGGASTIRRIDFARQMVTTIVGTRGRAEDHDDVLAQATTNTPLNVRIVGGHMIVMNQSNLRIVH